MQLCALKVSELVMPVDAYNARIILKCLHTPIINCASPNQVAWYIAETGYGLFHLIAIHPLWMTNEENLTPGHN